MEVYGIYRRTFRDKMNNSNIFTSTLQTAISKGVAVDNVVDASNWFKNRSQTVNTQRELVKVRDRYRNVILPGRMYLFQYDAKHKSTLPYYDIFPLVFPFKKVPGGFLGLNVHYLPFNYRARLMDSLYDLSVNREKNDESTRLRLAYSVLESSAKFKFFKPCVKHYLNNNVTSRFVYIEPNEWNIALFLPLQRFAGATTRQVYNDSIKKFQGRR